MATTAAILYFVYLFNLATGYVLLDDDENTSKILTLPTEYNMRAERIDLLSDQKVPIELWYSTEYNRSRADVYGGMVKRFFYWGEEGSTSDDGILYMINPKWTEKEGHTTACDQFNMTEEQRIDAFPEDEDYIYSGKIWHEGKKVDVWTSSYVDDNKNTRREVVLYSYRSGRGEDVPVQIEEKVMNTMLGSLDTHLIFNYDRFNPLLCERDLDAYEEEACKSTDNPDKHMKKLSPSFHNELDVVFNRFKTHHKKEYHSKTEHDRRKEIFYKNWQFIVEHNRQNLGYKLALNHLSDLSPAERDRMNGGRRSSNPSATLVFPHTKEEVSEIMTQIPEEYDMRLEAVISPVKDQGLCGSCWTFGTTAAVEGALARLDGRLLDLSEQSLIDCSWQGDNAGCDGGFPKLALEHIMKHGLPLEEDYGGYLGQNGYCHLENATELFKIRGFTMVTPMSVSAMKVALFKYGPVIVTIQANDAFQFYKSGVFYDHTCVEDEINHVVTIVGYGSRDGAEYWILKNSYGQQWGEDGYMLLSSLNNNCFVLDEPYYPVV